MKDATLEYDSLIGHVHFVRTPSPGPGQRDQGEGADQNEADQRLVTMDEAQATRRDDNQGTGHDGEEKRAHEAPGHRCDRNDRDFALSKNQTSTHTFKVKDRGAPQSTILGESGVTSRRQTLRSWCAAISKYAVISSNWRSVRWRRSRSRAPVIATSHASRALFVIANGS